MDIKEEILAQMDSALRPEFDKAIDNTIERAFKEDVKTLGFIVANSIKCQWEVMKPHLFYSYCLGVKAQEARTQAVPKWISVQDKLPEFQQEVLILVGDEYLVAEYLPSETNEFGIQFKEGFWINGGASVVDADLWMSLPQPPKAQEQSHD